MKARMIDLALLPFLCYAANMIDAPRRCCMENPLKLGVLRTINFRKALTWSRRNSVPDIRLS